MFGKSWQIITLLSLLAVSLVHAEEQDLGITCGSWGYDKDDALISLTMASDNSAGQEQVLLQCLDWAVNKGANINGKTADFHPLILAIDNGHEDLAAKLIDLGADPNTRDEHGLSALQHAAGAMADDLIEKMLSKGADPNLGDEHHAVPLLLAVDKADVRAVRALLAHGANANQSFDYSTEKQSPLDEATSQLIALKMSLQGDPEIVQYRMKQDYSPKSSAPPQTIRDVHQVYKDAQTVRGLIQAAGGTCVTTPCGGELARDQSSPGKHH